MRACVCVCRPVILNVTLFSKKQLTVLYIVSWENDDLHNELWKWAVISVLNSTFCLYSKFVFFSLFFNTDLFSGVSLRRPSFFRGQLCCSGALHSLFPPQPVLLDAHTGNDGFTCYTNHRFHAAAKVLELLLAVKLQIWSENEQPGQPTSSIGIYIENCWCGCTCRGKATYRA